jgi:Skp family chaperone for outer membrane proteins
LAELLTMPKILLLATALALATGISSAFAEDAPQSAGSQQLGGPPVPGVCVLSREAVLSSSKVGLAATARLRELAGQAQAEIDTERKSVQADMAALEKDKSAASAAEKRKPLVERWNAVQQKTGQRSRELEATREKALTRIALEAQPVIATVYRARNCGLLFAREVMLGGNSGADITPAVIQGLDAKIATLSFDRENLPAQPAQPGPLASR